MTPIDVLMDGKVRDEVCGQCGAKLLNQEQNTLAYSCVDQRWRHLQCAKNAGTAVTITFKVYVYPNVLSYEEIRP